MVIHSMDNLKTLIREVPDFPKPGINFYDITTLLKDPQGLTIVFDQIRDRYVGKGINKVLGIEARGFIFAPAIAYGLTMWLSAGAVVLITRRAGTRTARIAA